MLFREDNVLLTQIEPGTPMGSLFRRYWISALFAEEIPTPDCAPVRVRLLGEELVAFRASDGKIGLLGEHCAHRGTSLFFGRNEDCGLRCIYHGWKYDVDGNVLETPAEPAGSQLKSKVRHTAYPCDAFILQVRRFLLRAVKDVQAGKLPPGLIFEREQNDLAHLRCEAAHLPAGVSWRSLYE